MIKSHKKSIAGIILIAFCSQFSFGQRALRRDEQEIYALVAHDIKKIEGDWSGTSPKPVIVSGTYRVNRAFEDGSEWEGSDRSKKGLAESFESANQEFVLIPKSFTRNCRCELISRIQLTQLLDRGRKEFETMAAEQINVRGVAPTPGDVGPTWDYFQKRFPRTIQYYEFSGIGLSANQKWAVVETNGTGPYSFSQCSHLLKKTQRRWRIVEGSCSHGVS
jgi:hypothetical protein